MTKGTELSAYFNRFQFASILAVPFVPFVPPFVPVRSVRSKCLMIEKPIPYRTSVFRVEFPIGRPDRFER
jgi:hypothetical protein